MEGDVHLAQTWGHKLNNPPPQHIIRICFLNFGGFHPQACKIPPRERGKCACKDCALQVFTTANRIDVMTLAETNLHWKKIKIESQLPERTHGWYEALHLNYAYYKNYKNEGNFQAGGVALLSINKMAHRVLDQGVDESGLGRYCWTRYKGKGEIKLRVVSAYRPVNNKEGLTSVWNQQKGYFETEGEARCPRELFVQDLVKAITGWIEAGDQLVLCADVNEDVRDCALRQQLGQLGLVEALMDVHDQATAPPTFQRGKVPIDTIFVSSTLRGARCGYLEFWGNDHRPLWLEVPMEQGLGYETGETVRPSARRLKLEDPRVVQRYQQSLAESDGKYNLHARAQALNTAATSYPLQPDLCNEWEEIDRLHSEGIFYAERNCRKLKMGSISWTPAFHKAQAQLDFSYLLCKKLSGGNVDSRHLKRLATKAAMTDKLSLKLSEAQTLRLAIQKGKKSVRINSNEQRSTWLESLAEARAAAGNISAEQEIRNLRHREQQRRIARLIKRVNNKLRSGALTAVIGPDSEGTMMEYTDKLGMERACLEENSRRFNQCQETPMLQEPLYSQFGPLAMTAAGTEVLLGTYEAPSTSDRDAVKFLKQLTIPAELVAIPRISMEQTKEEYQWGWKKQRERTSSGPSGIHFGHRMAGALHDEIGDIERILANIPFRSGYTPQRWLKGLNIMLEKKKGVIEASKLRCILLYESDFNHMNKYFGRQLMRQAEKYNLIAPEQYGSRKGLSAIDQCLNKCLTYDMARLLKEPMALCSNDAKGCYDRVVHSTASLALRRLGASDESIRCMFSTIENLKHTVRTIYGDSEQNFGGPNWKLPCAGIGQGNGAGPHIWVAISSPLLNLLRSEGFGIRYQVCMTEEQISFVGYSFVDDADLLMGSREGADSVHEVASRMQKALDLWEGGLRATGGALEPTKSFWYLNDFQWKDGRWKYATIDQIPADINVKDPDGKQVQLERLEHHEARRTLGVRLAPDGNNKAEFDYLMSEAQIWADRTRTGHLPAHAAWQSFQTVFMKKVEYRLPATTFSKKACDKIMSKVLAAALPCSGIARTLPRAMVFGPLKFQGLNVPDMYVLQGIAHIDRIVRFSVHSKHLQSQLLRACHAQMRLELGMNGSIFGKTYTDMKAMMTPTWLTCVWEFLSFAGIRLQDAGPQLRIRREKDVLLMETFYANKIKGGELARLNRCRLYLQVTTLADICTGCGTKIMHRVTQGTQPPWRSTYKWPKQGEPTKEDWKFFEEIVRKNFCRYDSLELKEPMGEWYEDDDTTIYFFDRRMECLYERGTDGQTWWKWMVLTTKQSRATVARFHDRQEVTQPVVQDLQPATAHVLRSRMVLTGYAPVTLRQTSSSITRQGMTLKELVADLDQSLSWCMDRVVADDDGNYVAQEIVKGTAIAVSDGSYNKGHGTASFVMEGQTDGRRIRADNQVRGHETDQSSYRSELAGLLGIVAMTELLCKKYDIQAGSIQVGCDGLSALNHAFDVDRRLGATTKHYDLLSALHVLLAKSPLTWKTKHVKGHQDSMAGVVLDRWATLNVEMDECAKAHWQRTYEAGSANTQEQTVWGEPWSVWVGERKLVGDIKGTIQEHVQGQPATQYWRKKGVIADDSGGDIDWNSTGHAMKNASIRRRQWITKHVTGFCATGKMMKRRGKRATDECPRCHSMEDAEHVWRCPDSRTAKLWEDSIRRLRDWMVARKTKPSIVEAVCQGLLGWYHAEPIGWNINVADLEGHQLATIQANTGWRNFFEGRPIQGWKESQQRHYEALGLRNSGLRWISALIRKLWDVAWDLWDQRNHILHGEEEDLKKSTLCQEIQLQFSMGWQGLGPDVRRHFSPGEAAVLRYPMIKMNAWVIRVQAARTIEDVGQNYRQERQGLRRWLRQER